MRIFKFSNTGFTLAEILVVIGVMSIAGLMIALIFQRTISGSNKAQILSFTKQNGQAALEIMDKTIRDSDNIVCWITSSPETIVIEKEGIYTRFRFVPPQSTSDGQKNGYIAQDNPPGYSDTLCVDALMGNFTLITDNVSTPGIKTGVSVINGRFTRSKQAGFGDVVMIKFDVKPGVDVSPALANQIDPIPFQTAIQLR